MRMLNRRISNKRTSKEDLLTLQSFNLRAVVFFLDNGYDSAAK